MSNSPFLPADILLPRNADMTRWACVACDQYTSEPAYWADADAFVGAAPSALRVVLPELYLNAEDVSAREAAVLSCMEDYRTGALFETVENSFVFVERRLRSGALRRGLVGMLDLEAYNYGEGVKPAVRATEGTVLSRIPPRLRIRSRASLELPHVMLLIDDAEDTVLSAAEALAGEVLYDFPLMQSSGSIRGRRIRGEEAADLIAAIDAFGDPAAFAARYQIEGEAVLHIAVGDGNHSLATAKAHYENLKAELGEAALSHPARYALCELVNLHDTSLEFEPIHRIVTNTDPAALLAAFEAACGARRGTSGGHNLEAVIGGERIPYTVENPTEPLCVGTLQKFLDAYLSGSAAEIDYIHGDDVVLSLSREENSVGFLLPAMAKEELFPAVVRGGALPRKTFSMGEAADKRFYVEARSITG
ncbi:MAG: DUF1015 domain-containing protein [Clostridia bacterium]|nr:DUF1015 domain-containing protein [Clostridia bacterium]